LFETVDCLTTQAESAGSQKKGPDKKVLLVVAAVAVGFIVLPFAYLYLASSAPITVNGLTLQFEYGQGAGGQYFGPSQQTISFHESTTAGSTFTATFTIVNQDSQAHVIDTIEPPVGSEFGWLPGYQLSPSIPAQVCTLQQSCADYSIPAHSSQAFTIEVISDCEDSTLMGTCSGPSYSGPLTLQVVTPH